MTVKAFCSREDAPFAMLLEQDSEGRWIVKKGYKISREQAARGYGPSKLKGIVLSDPEYECPHCGASSFFLCSGCGTVNCQGTIREQDGERYVRCVSCNREAYLRGYIEELDGFADL